MIVIRDYLKFTSKYLPKLNIENEWRSAVKPHVAKTLNPIKVMNTCKNSGSYQKISLKYWYLKISRWRDFAVPRLTKIAIIRTISEIWGLSFGFSPLFMWSKITGLQLRLKGGNRNFNFFRILVQNCMCYLAIILRIRIFCSAWMLQVKILFPEESKEGHPRTGTIKDSKGP